MMGFMSKMSWTLDFVIDTENNIEFIMYGDEITSVQFHSEVDIDQVNTTWYCPKIWMRLQEDDSVAEIEEGLLLIFFAPEGQIFLAWNLLQPFLIAGCVNGKWHIFPSS